MKRLTFAAGAALSALALFATPSLAAGPQRAGHDDTYIVQLRDGVPARSVAHGLAAAANGEARLVYEHALSGFSFRGSLQAAQRLAADPDVLRVTPDDLVSISGSVDATGRPGGGGGGGAQVTPWGISRIGGAGSGTGKTVYVIDTGIDLAHADLYVDTACSANFVTKGKNSPADGNGHGTHVSGTIAAKNNSIDVVGVAAGARLCAVRVLDNAGSGTWSGVIAGMDFVAANGQSGDVANMSLGGPANASVDDALVNMAGQGIKVAVAAGNDGADASNYSPARVNHANVYTISAIDSGDCLASWSNDGAPVDYAAPGVGILSTKKGGGTTTMSGTSMASPHVAGLLALGAIHADGSALCDSDGKADPIAHR